MESLRWILLGAGVLFVIAVYVLSRRRSQSSETYTYTETDDTQGFSAVDLDDLDEGVGEVRVVASDRDVPDTVERKQESTATGNQHADSSGQPDSEIITVFILAPSKEECFVGDRINSAVRSCGMVFGDMNIFHKIDDDNRILFSLANMLNPGSFDPASLFETRTTGLAVFLQLDAVDDPNAALDDMLSTAYHISELLGGQLCNHKRAAISQQDTEEYRQLAAKY